MIIEMKKSAVQAIEADAFCSVKTKQSNWGFNADSNLDSNQRLLSLSKSCHAVKNRILVGLNKLEFEPREIIFWD